VLCCSQSSTLNAKDKNLGPAAGDVAATNLKMLQGKWQAVDDKSDFLVFENNHRKENYPGQWRQFINEGGCSYSLTGFKIRM